MLVGLSVLVSEGAIAPETVEIGLAEFSPLAEAKYDWMINWIESARR